MAIRAPFLYTFDGRPEALKSGQRQVVQQTVMHTFLGQSFMHLYTGIALPSMTMTLDVSCHAVLLRNALLREAALVLA